MLARGQGPPILSSTEFGGDSAPWNPQVADFSRAHRLRHLRGARGYPPSDVPTDPAAYSQDRAVADALAVLDATGTERAVVVGN